MDDFWGGYGSDDGYDWNAGGSTADDPMYQDNGWFSNDNSWGDLGTGGYTGGAVQPSWDSGNWFEGGGGGSNNWWEQDQAPLGDWAQKTNFAEDWSAGSTPDTNWNPNATTQQMGGTNWDSLQKILSGPLSSALTKGIGALFEGNSNKKMAKSLNNIATNPALDPFGSQRPFYQQQAQQAIADPYSSPMVKAQIDNMQRVQNIKDAAAGRRSNVLSSQPGVMAEQAKIAQDYLKTMMQGGGSGFGPAGSSIASALTQGAGYDARGYTAPIASAVGNIQQGGQNTDMLQQLIAALSKGQ